MDRGEEKSEVVRHQLQYHQYSCRMQDALEVACRAVRDTSDKGLRLIVTWRVANVATVIISTEVNHTRETCNRVRIASEEEVQNSSPQVAEQGTQIEFNLVS